MSRCNPDAKGLGIRAFCQGGFHIEVGFDVVVLVSVYGVLQICWCVYIKISIYIFTHIYIGGSLW